MRKMFAPRFYCRTLSYWRLSCRYLNTKDKLVNHQLLCKYLNLNVDEAKYMYIKYPILRKFDDTKMLLLLGAITNLGYNKQVLLQEPLLFCYQPLTLRLRYQVLNECGVQNISPNYLAHYLTLVKKKTIGELKNRGDIISHLNVENRLASFMTQWPTSLTTLIYGDVNDTTLFILRLKILQRYLELTLELTTEEFQRGILTYPTIKHRPLAVINETLNILQSEIMIPVSKIRSNLYLIHSEPQNLRNIIHKFRSIGGIDIKEIIKLHPKLALKNYDTIVEIRKILKEFDINDEAQRRCFDIYTLSPNTIRERLEKAKTIPEFATFSNHPRFLKMIHYNNTVMNRLQKLYEKNKKCLSLNILSGSNAHYEVYVKAPGDRLGKGKDLIFCISQCLGKEFRSSDIRSRMKRHPYWINISLVQVKYVYQKLSQEYTAEDIFENCPILLYPWSKINSTFKVFSKKIKTDTFKTLIDQVDLNQLNKSQKLSLVLYLLEQDHYFSGNGVWVEDKCKNLEEISSETTFSHPKISQIL